MKAAGWFSGSNHIHMNYGGNLHNTPENLIFIASAEDNDVIGEKVANKDNRIFDHQYFTGKPDERSTAEHLLFFDEEYRPPFYGHISFINLTKHLISPFTTGYEGTAIESLYPSNTDIFRLTRAQGALNGYVHPWRNDPTRSGYGVARGYPVDVALGMLDYLELMAGSDHLTTTGVWHRSLNCGFKISATAGEDSIVNLHRSRPVGLSRTYAHLGPKLDWRRWVEAIREGRTFVTNGPLLSFQVDGRMPGDEVRLPDTGGSVEIALRMQSIVPVDKVEVLFNGRVAETLAGGTEAELRKRIAVKTSGWLTVRAYGTKPVHPIDDRYVFGETGPVYVYCGDRPIRSREDAAYFIRWIDEITRQANAHPGWRSEGERRHVLGQFAEARKVFEQRAREAATQ
jgi:hypothetical protein